MPVEKTCVMCGARFSVPPVRDKSAKTCSLRCRGEFIAQAYAAQRIEKACLQCGVAFHVPKCQAARRKFCSDKCAAPARAVNRARGEQHYLWSGGQAHHTDGYLYLSMPGHPFGKTSNGSYVFEHRVVVETVMRESAPNHSFLVEIDGQKYLRPEIEVHHINGNKRDNRPTNLLACTAPAHRAIHNGVAPMTGEVWPEIDGLAPFQPRIVIRQCRTCGTTFKAKRSDVSRGGGLFCSRDCYDKRVRKPFTVEIR